jgi:hypothetical protein
MNSTVKVDRWTPGFAGSSPMFAPFANLPLCTMTQWPQLPDLQGLLDARDVRTASGRGVRLNVQAIGDARLPYERRLFESGEMGWRAQNWHDLFNVLVYATFPRMKSALNARHHAALASEVPGQRGRERDALTLFDESGVIVMSERADLLQLIRDFDWHRLFWQERESVRTEMTFIVFGHSLYEKALHPYVGMTGHALLLDTPCGNAAMSGMGGVDMQAAGLVAQGALGTPGALAPLPLLGVPGWWPANEMESFYANDGYFRRGRRTDAATR